MSREVQIDYDNYVHFAVRIADYLLNVCKTNSSVDHKAVTWYLRNYKECTSNPNLPSEQLEVIYRRLVENLIYDKCVDVLETNLNKRIIKINEQFTPWPWRRQAQHHEDSIGFEK